MGTPVGEQQVFPWQIGATGLTVTYRILHWSGTAWDTEDSGDMIERPGGLYEVKFTPDEAGFWLALAYYTADYNRYDFGVAYFIGTGVEYDNYTILTDGTYGLDAIQTLIAGLDSISAADVWSEAGRELSTPSNYMANVSSLALEATLTAIKGGGWSTETLKAVYDLIAGLNDIVAADVWSAGSRELSTPANYKADVSTLETRLSATRAGYLEELDFAIQEAITALQTDLDNPNQYKADVSGLAPSGEYNTEMGYVTEAVATEAKQDVIDGYHDVPAKNSTDDAQMSDAIGKKSDDAQTVVGTTRSIIAYIKGILDTVVHGTYGLSALKTLIDNIQSDVVDTKEGKVQVLEVSVTNPLNNGITTVATVGTQPCVIEGIVIHADTGAHVDMTTCAVEGGVGQVITFIGVADAIEANLDAVDKQVGWTGIVRLAVGKIIYIDLQGSGATAADLTIIIKYRACVDGGVLS